MNWPNDPDGDVFRVLKSQGFDFTRSYLIDFNVDFDGWPPEAEAISILTSIVGEVLLYDPDEFDPGFAQFNINGIVTYELVTEMQRKISNAMFPFGGRCESWGVMGLAPES